MPALSRTEIEIAVGSAALAPSVLNTQPWQFVARRDGALELRRDPRRVLRAIDPHHRALTISCGAALYNLRLAIAALGRLPEVQLLPDPTDGTLLATIRAVEPYGPTPAELRLHRVVGERRTSRLPFLDQPLPPEAVLTLEDAAEEERTTLRVLSKYEAEDIGRLIKEADLAQRADRETRAEIARWTRRGPAARDGIPDAALGPAPRDPSTLVRDFALGTPVPDRPHADFEPVATLAVLLSHRDEPAAWIRAGQALERVWLEATCAGLALSLLTQPLELSNLRWLARPLTAARSGSLSAAGPDSAAHSGGRPFWPQALMRIGVAQGRTPPTPRRPLDDLLTFA